MPARTTPLVNNETYHVLNRSINLIPIFSQRKEYQRFLDGICYYQNFSTPFKFSSLKIMPVVERAKLWENLRKKRQWRVEIFAYCLIPNHFHLLLKQLVDNGITDFIRCLNDSYSHYFNIKYKRKGPLFEGRFKAIRVETNEQLLHLCRYIHLNPYSSFLIKDLNRLEKYSFSSLGEYLKLSKDNICQKEIILSQFQNLNKYKEFVFDQADYQRTLQIIKHQIPE